MIVPDPRTVLLRSALMVGILGASLSGCRDELTTPADCPALCPGGQQPVQELVLPATLNMDTSYFGYVGPGIGPSLRISNGLPASEDRALTVFLPRPDSITVNDTARAIVRLDSAAISLTLQKRDTLVTGLKLFIYSLPTDLDTNTTFADVDPQFIAANLIDSIVVPDSLKAGTLRAVISGVDTIRLKPDSIGRIGIGVTITANAPTGIRIASIAATGSPNLTSYFRVNLPSDTTKAKQTLVRFPQFNTFVSQNPAVSDLDLLPVGGAPSARALLRFALPVAIRDSVTILRATLEMTPDVTIHGLPNDPATLQAFGAIGDLGAKSPIISSGNTIATTTIDDGTSSTVSIDITRLVRIWQGSTGVPQLVFLAISPEAASFTSPVFRSTRSASGAPQVRITYYQQFPFERP
ncbi:MAG: hypothetical protein ABI679_12120 [Gemmatimonadota bacterium]